MSAPHKIDAETLLYAGLGALAAEMEPEREGDRRHFEDLVERGRRAAREQSVVEGKGQLGSQRRITSALHRMDIPTRTEIETLTRRVEELAARLEGKMAAMESDLEVREPAAAGGRSLAPVLDEGLPSLLSRLTGDNNAVAAVPDLVEAVMPSSVPTAAAVLQARRNSAARTQLIEEVGLLTSAEVAEINQSRAENRSALASRWKGEGLIFSVSHQGRDYFPGFQFDAQGKPRKGVANVLQALGGVHGWETALWFTAPNAYLDDRRPLDLLETDPDAVVEAARHEGEDVWF